MDLFQLIRLGQIDELQKHLDEENIDATDEDGQNLLHEAIASRRIEIGRFLLQKGIPINHQDKEGRTPLHYAAIYSSPEFTRLLIDNGATLNLTDCHENTALWNAVFNAKGHYDVTRALIIAGADPHHKNKHNKSPLDFATQINDPKLIAILKKLPAS